MRRRKRKTKPSAGGVKDFGEVVCRQLFLVCTFSNCTEIRQRCDTLWMLFKVSVCFRRTSGFTKQTHHLQQLV